MSIESKLVVNIIGRPGAGKTSGAHRMAELFGGSIYRPSDTLRDYADRHDVHLKRRIDYVDCHRRMLADNPDSMIRPAVDSPARLLIIDGLRVVAHAERLVQAVGMRTIALDAPPEIRLRNIRAAGEWRQYRDESYLDSVQALLDDEAADDNNLDPLEPNVSSVMAMAEHTIDIGEDTLEATVHLEEAFVIGHWLRRINEV